MAEPELKLAADTEVRVRFPQDINFFSSGDYISIFFKVTWPCCSVFDLDDLTILYIAPFVPTAPDRIAVRLHTAALPSRPTHTAAASNILQTSDRQSCEPDSSPSPTRYGRK